MKEWSPEEIETLKTLHANGCSFREIADALPRFSRNSVIGKARRLKLPYREGADKYKPAHLRVGPRKHQRPPKPKPQAVAGPKHVPKCLLPLHKPLLEVGTFECKWITSGDGEVATYCALPCEHGSFCAFHASVARQPYVYRPKVGDRRKRL